MIDYVSGGEFLDVTSNKGYYPTVNTYQPITGMVAFDCTTQSLKLFDGNNWTNIGGGTANIKLDGRAISILKWAEQKMQEEKELASIIEKHPHLMAAVNEVEHAKQALQTLITLAKDHGTTTG